MTSIAIHATDYDFRFLNVYNQTISVIPFAYMLFKPIWSLFWTSSVLPPSVYATCYVYDLFH